MEVLSVVVAIAEDTTLVFVKILYPDSGRQASFSLMFDGGYRS
jgi:hypothetical protein